MFVSGQIPLEARTQQLVAGEIEAQTEQALVNLEGVLEAAGSSLGQVVRTTIYLIDLSLFPRVNAVYARHFASRPAPARSTIQAAGLPLGAQIEIDAIATLHPDG